MVAQPSAALLKEPAVAAGALVAETTSFGDTVERLLEVMLVVIVGVSLTHHWDARAILVAGFLMVGLRPLATHLILIGTPATTAQRSLIGWFGIRGIGSLYYLCYALNHGVSGEAARDACALTISIIAISVVAHGVSARPLLARYERALQARAPVPQRRA
jgi:NhaP-type Na+/H+ or K+/H+ antiporter